MESLLDTCRRDPEWAAKRIQELERELYKRKESKGGTPDGRETVSPSAACSREGKPDAEPGHSNASGKGSAAGPVGRKGAVGGG